MNARVLMFASAVLSMGLWAEIPAERRARGPASETTAEVRRAETFLSAGPGIALYNGNVGPSLNLGFLREASEGSSLFFGLDLAVNIWTFNPTGTAIGVYSTNHTALQLLPTLMYRFDVLGNRVLYPYLGVSVGPNVFIDRQRVVAASGVTDATTTNLYFELLFRPGFFTHLSRSVALDFEAKFGVLASQFIFLPQISAVVSL